MSDDTHLDTGTKLAFERTYLAEERTQMAWVRTSLSFILFGFGLAKFFQYLNQRQGQNMRLFSPHTAGLLMIGIGLASLGIATLQHQHAVKRLHAQCADLPFSVANATSILLFLLGVGAFIGSIVRF